MLTVFEIMSINDETFCQYANILHIAAHQHGNVSIAQLSLSLYTRTKIRLFSEMSNFVCPIAMTTNCFVNKIQIALK